MTIDLEWGCDHCRNDGRLDEGRCPKCDAEYLDDDCAYCGESFPELDESGLCDQCAEDHGS